MYFVSGLKYVPFQNVLCFEKKKKKKKKKTSIAVQEKSEAEIPTVHKKGKKRIAFHGEIKRDCITG